MIVEILVLKAMTIKMKYYVVPINKIIKYLELKSKHKLKLINMDESQFKIKINEIFNKHKTILS